MNKKGRHSKNTIATIGEPNCMPDNLQRSNVGAKWLYGCWPKKLFVATVVFVGISLTSAADDFDSRTLPRLVIVRNYSAAVKDCETAVAHYRQQIATDSKTNVWTGLHILNVGFYLCAKAQALALQGSFKQANASLEEAESYGNSESLNNPGGMMTASWQGILSATRGLILEKQGDLSAAKACYRSHQSDHADGRLALLAFRSGDKNEAARLAGGGDTITKQIVLGLLAKANGQLAESKNCFTKAADQLKAPPANEFLPIFYCEPVPDFD
jgi:tetratricopeptide (TPR) repeat protein